MIVDSRADGELRDVFQGMLNNALTRGRITHGGSCLGPGTVPAIAAVASEHPDADAAVITAAFDASDREHRC
ncbi:hypothetical protein AB4Z42_20745 [Mycobacterium sp. 2YAF39]|uniref:hypothetical protein n=1 Tax=Mycobacterium sp. 2YAF39 TaxID=3233033 RepID=UPI003F9A3570